MENNLYELLVILFSQQTGIKNNLRSLVLNNLDTNWNDLGCPYFIIEETSVILMDFRQIGMPTVKIIIPENNCFQKFEWGVVKHKIWQFAEIVVNEGPGGVLKLTAQHSGAKHIIDFSNPTTLSSNKIYIDLLHKAHALYDSKSIIDL